MSYNSVKQSPRSSNCSGVSQSRSISDVILSLKTSFLDTEYSGAVRELKAWEEGLRRKKEEIVGSLRERNDMLETELGELKLEKYMWDGERKKLLRDFAVNDDKLNDLARELSLAKEKEGKAFKRYDRLLEELQKMEEDKDVLIRNLADLSDIMDKQKIKLREKEGVIDELVRKNVAQSNEHLEELERVQNENACLEEEKLNFDARLKEYKREKDKKVEELVERKEAEKRQVEERMYALLTEQKAEYQAHVEELRKSNGEKDERIKKLMEEIKFLEKEHIEILKKKDEKIQQLEKEKELLCAEKSELTARLGQVEERFLKLEGDVISSMCLDLRGDKRFASTRSGKIISEIIKALDSEEFGLTCDVGENKDENHQEAVVAQSQLKPHVKPRLTAARLLAKHMKSSLASGTMKAPPPPKDPMKPKKKQTTTLPASTLPSVHDNLLSDADLNMRKKKRSVPSPVGRGGKAQKTSSESASQKSKGGSSEKFKEPIITPQEQFTYEEVLGEGTGTTPNHPKEVLTSRPSASYVNEPKSYLKTDKQSIEAVRKTLDFEAEFCKDVAADNKKTGVDDPIIIDSDDENDDENFLHVMGLNNKRQCPGSLKERINHDSEDNLNPKRKIKKLKHVRCEQVMQECCLTVSSNTKSDHKFSTSQKQTLATPKKCLKNLRREVSVSRSHSFLEDDGRKSDNSKSSYGTPSADKLLNPEVEEYMTSLRQRKQDKKLVCIADMVCAFDQDVDFCAKAVCAIYRHSIFEECDFERVTTLAKFLTDGNPNGKMKKSVDELQQHDPRGIVDCKRLATKYSKKLIDIYRNKGDPLFSPLTDLKYN